MPQQPICQHIVVGFDYSILDEASAGRVRAAVGRVRLHADKAIQGIIAIGEDLLAVKDALPHGKFGLWLEAEFGWKERTARNFMAVANLFGPKSATIADLAIQPTAAYLLAAPSVPSEAREEAVRRAEGGEQITAKVAREIVAATRKEKQKGRSNTAVVPPKLLKQRLRRTLVWYKDRWRKMDLSEFVDELNRFAEELTKGEISPDPYLL